MAAATCSSDPNLRQSADCRKLGPTFSHGNGRSKHVFRSCFFFASQQLVFSQSQGKVGFFLKKLSNFSEGCVFDFSELGVLLLRTCFLACFPPSHVLCSLPPSHFILLFHKSCERTCQRSSVFFSSHNSSCRKVKSSRPSGGGFLALVPDDLPSRHEAFRDYRGNAVAFTLSLDFFHLPPG